MMKNTVLSMIDQEGNDVDDVDDVDDNKRLIEEPLVENSVSFPCLRATLGPSITMKCLLERVLLLGAINILKSSSLVTERSPPIG